LEGFHAHLRRIINGLHTSPRGVTCILALSVFRWNIDRSGDREILDKTYGSWYNNDVILQIQDFLQGTSYAEHFEDYKNYKDLTDTGDTFVMPVVTELELFRHIVPDSNGANEDENADIFNSDNLYDGIGQ
jgi:hypothetical protein